VFEKPTRTHDQRKALTKTAILGRLAGRQYRAGVAGSLWLHLGFSNGAGTAGAWLVWHRPPGRAFFFVISGFLITWLLLQEQVKHDAISLKHFYVRRALRILPVYFLYLLILGCLTRYSQPASA